MKIEIDLDVILETFLSTHFAYKHCEKMTYTTNDNACLSEFSQILYDILEENLGREKLIEMLQKP